MNFNTSTIGRIVREKTSEFSAQHVILAKGFLINYKNQQIEAPTALREFLLQQGITMGTINLENRTEEESIGIASNYLNYQIAFGEAYLELINNGDLIRIDSRDHTIDMYISWSTRSQTAGWDFRDFNIYLPFAVRKPFYRQGKPSLFSDPDVNLLLISAENAHKDVKEALKDTIACFKNELYGPTLTMLGKAVEGAWIELGLSLLSLLQPSTEVEKDKEKLMGLDNLVWKIEKVIKLYDRQDLFAELSKASGIKPRNLIEIRMWTDIVRDSRNAIHFGAAPQVNNDFDKTSTILLSAVSHLKNIYHLKKCADELK